MELKRYRAASGFSLIEVMIAVVILSFGLLALAAFHGSLLRAGGEAKARAAATALAQEVIEEGRSFAYLTKPNPAYTGATYVDSLVSFGAKKVSSGGIDYTITRTVKRFNPAGAELAGTFDPASPEFKFVQVNVNWAASDGTTKNVSLEDAVASIAPADSTSVVKGPLEIAKGPEVRIEPPNKDNPAVVPIAVGDDKSAASSNPVPRRFSKVDDNTAATLFSVHTFTGSPGGDEVLLNRKLDVGAVTCRCNKDGSKSTSTNPAYEPTVWNGKQLAYMEPRPLPVGTPIGVFQDKGQASKDIEAMCDTCCRDHHESASRTQRPDPHRALETKEQGGLEHYLFSNLKVPASAGSDYSEACQLIRVNGRMRLSVDPKQNFLLTVPLNSTGTGHEPANFASRYSALVVDYVKAGVAALPSGYLSPTASFPAFDENAYAPTCAPLTTCDTKYADILRPAPIQSSVATTKTLVSFGLYVDYVNSDTKAAYDCADTKSTDPKCDGLRDRNPLETLPFYAINVANLGQWSTSPGSGTFSVTSPTFDNKGILQGTGGVVTLPVLSSCRKARIDITRSSSGVAGRSPIDPDDASDANKAFDETLFGVGC